MAATDINYYWFKGDLFIARYNDEVLGGYTGPLNAVKVTLLASGDPKRVVSNMRADFGQNKALAYMPKPTEFEMELSSITRPLMAAGLLGTDSDYTQASGSHTSVSLTLIKDYWVETGYLNISNVRYPVTVTPGSNTGNGTMGTVTVTPATAQTGNYTVSITATAVNGGTFSVTKPDSTSAGTGTVGAPFSGGGIAFTLADGATDFAMSDSWTIAVIAADAYEVNAELGLVKSLTVGASGSKTLTIDVGGVTGDKIIGATESVVQFKVRMIVENNNDGQSGELIIPKVSVTPSSAMSLVGAQEFQTIPFKGEVISLSGQDLFTFKPNLTFA